MLMVREQAKQILFYHFNTPKIYELRNDLSLVLSRVGLLRSDFFSCFINQMWSPFTFFLFSC